MKVYFSTTVSHWELLDHCGITERLVSFFYVRKLPKGIEFKDLRHSNLERGKGEDKKEGVSDSSDVVKTKNS